MCWESAGRVLKLTEGLPGRRGGAGLEGNTSSRRIDPQKYFICKSKLSTLVSSVRKIVSKFETSDKIGLAAFFQLSVLASGVNAVLIQDLYICPSTLMFINPWLLFTSSLTVCVHLQGTLPLAIYCFL